MHMLSLPNALPHQAPILLDGSRFKLAVCGRRFGKTATGLMAAVRGHGPAPGFFRGVVNGARVWWVVPSYPQIESSEVWIQLKKACEGAKVRISEVERRIDIHGGGSITVRSADGKDSLLGAGLDGLVVDEAARIHPQTWAEKLRPMLADRQGWCMMLTTPNGKNWIHKLFGKIRGGDMPGWNAWQRPSGDNPLVSQAEMDDILRTIGPRAFAQEHLAQFTDIEGALFPASYFEDAIWVAGMPGGFELSAIAVDPSVGKEARPGDPSAIIFAGLAAGKIWVDADIRRRPPVEIVADTIRMFQRYNPTAVAVESNGFQSVLEPMFHLVCERDNLPPLPIDMVNHHERKAVRIQRLDPYMANGQLRFVKSDGCDQLIEQLQMFPDNAYHDDGPDALEMAIAEMNHIAAGLAA